MADRRKLAQGLMMMTPSARADIAQQADEFERFKQADYLRKMGEQGAGLAKSVARGVPQMATGLVDLASMPFEAAGVLQPGQAVGSTKWLENRGYLPESQPGFANQLTELLSGGFDPSDLITKGAPMLAALRTTWHGSPHGFERFDLSKIGTGEGAQAYGHGLYLAEARPVAEEYATNLSKDVFNVGGELFNPADIKHLNVRALARKGDIDSAIKKATELAASDSPVADLAKLDLDLLQQAKAKGGFQEATGYLYKVELPDEQIAKMLDWDKPLSEQPHVMKFINDEEAKRTKSVLDQRIKTLESMGETHPNVANVKKQIALLEEEMANPMGSGLGTLTGGEYYDYLRRREIDPKAQAEMFMQQGIPGIQYLDQASRGAGEGTRNYVVFSDEIPQILERNGQPIAQALREYKQQFPEGMLGKTGMFETGTPASFEYIRNTEKSPYMGEKFGQDIEPAGRYLSYKDPVVNMESMPNTWETGQVSFNNPLVVNFGESYGTPTNWKNMLSESFGGKTGKDLSKAIAESGYDGIVTVDKYGTSEIVDLSNFLSKEK